MLRALGVVPEGPQGADIAASVAAALGTPDSVGPEAVVAAMAAAGLPLSRCRAYHVGKALGRRALEAPVVVERTPESLRVAMTGYREVEEGGAVALVLGVRVGAGPEEEVEVEGGVAQRGQGGPCTVHHIVTGLGQGVEVAVRVRARSGVPALDACVGWSPVTRGVTQRRVGAPGMAAVVAIGPTSLTLDLDNPGAVSDPVGVGLVVECNGVESVVGVGGGTGAGAGPDAPGPGVVRHVLSGLAEGTVYSVRYRCVVGEAGLDAGAPWSPVLSVTTSTAVLERILVGGLCIWHGGGASFSLCKS